MTVKRREMLNTPTVDKCGLCPTRNYCMIDKARLHNANTNKVEKYKQYQ